MEKNTSTKINIKDKYGNEYLLEYNRSSAQMIEKNGFDLDKFDAQPNVMIPLLWHGAFLMHHRNVKTKDIDDIYQSLSDKAGLLSALADMYGEATRSLLEDGDTEKNVTWGIAD